MPSSGTKAGAHDWVRSQRSSDRSFACFVRDNEDAAEECCLAPRPLQEQAA